MMLMLCLGGCKGEATPTPGPAPSCQAEVVTEAGSFRATAKAEGTATARTQVRERALEAACHESCKRTEKPDACRARCLVDIDAAKVGARVKCHRFPEGDKGPTSG